MADQWREMPFSQAVIVNPRVQLRRGAIYPFVDMGAITPGSRSAYACEERQFEGGGSRFEIGDTLLARITPCLENGKIARFSGEAGEVAHGSTEFIVIRGREGLSTTDYAYYLTKWNGVTGFAISQMTGTSGRQRVPTDAFDHLEVPVPPVREQRVIAHILGTLDDKIELNRRMNETLEAIARAIFKSWFVDFDPVRAKAEGRPTGLPPHLDALFPNSFQASDLGEIPKGWRFGTFGEIAKSIKRSVAAAQINAEEPYIGLEHLPRNSISLGEWGRGDEVSSQKARFVRREVLFGKLRPYFHKVGIAPLDGICSTDILVLDAKCPANYAQTVLTASSKAMIDHVTAASDGTKMPRTKWEDLARFRIAIAPEDVSKSFTSVCAPMFDKIVSTAHENQTLAVLRDALLPKLISGEIRVPQAKEMVAAT